MKERTATGKMKNILPRTGTTISTAERQKKASEAGSQIGGAGQSLSGSAGPSGSTSRVPGRRYYDPTLMSSSLYLPRDFKLKNKWRRWWYTHDAIVGMVLDTHSEMAHSKAEIICDDASIKRTAEDMFSEMNLFSNLGAVDLEFMKIGEVTLYDLFDKTKGYFVKTVIHNPDFVEVSASQLAPDQPVVELRPSTDLKRLVMSTNPRDLKLKKRIPKEILARVATGRNIPLEPEFTTRIARLANPYDIRGTSLMDRLFRILMYEDKLNEAQITVADNFIYPLKIFKLGDPQTGWVPDETHMVALQELLLQQHFDPNFSLIFHYGLQYEQHGMEGKILRMDREWERIDKIKMVALGISQNFLYGDSTFASANAALQVLLSRYQAKRDLFEQKWIKRLLTYVGKQNGWYKVSQAELNGQYRIKRSAEEEAQRLIIPEISWRKKLTSRDDQQFLSWLSGIFKDGNGPISNSTFLSSAGFNLEAELRRKKNDTELEQKIGRSLLGQGAPVPGAPGGAPGAPGAPGAKPAGGPPVPGGPAAGLPPPPSAGLKGVRDKIASIIDKIRGKQIVKEGETAPRITAEEVKTLLEAGQVEFMKEVKEAVGWFPELKDSFDDSFFVGTEKKAKPKEDNKFGVLLNSEVDDEVDFFINTINTLPFEKTFNKNVAFIYGNKIAVELEQSIKAIDQQITSQIKNANSDIEDVPDFVKTLRNTFSASIKTSMHDVYSAGKLHTYKRTNYIAHKNFLKRQYNDTSSNLTSDGFVDTIVVEENLMLFEYILVSMVNSLTKNKSLEQIPTNEISKLINLYTKVLLFQMFSIGLLRGYEEQGFEEVTITPCNPDILSTDMPVIRETIAEIFALGEGSFQKLYKNAVLFNISPVYSENTSLVEGFNDKMSFKVKDTSLLDIPVVYSDFLTNFVNSFNLKLSSIKFITSPSDIPDLNKLISEDIEVKDPQLKMAMYQKELHRVSQEPIFRFGKKLYVVMSQLNADFEKLFIEAVYKDIDKAKTLLSKKIGSEIYNITEGQFKKLLDAKILVESNEVYKFSNSKVPSSDYSEDLVGLLNLMQDFDLYDNFLWDKTGALISNFSLMLNEDYFRVALPIYFNNPEFLKRYYPSHHKVLSTL